MAQLLLRLPLRVLLLLRLVPLVQPLELVSDPPELLLGDRQLVACQDAGQGEIDHDLLFLDGSLPLDEEGGLVVAGLALLLLDGAEGDLVCGQLLADFSNEELELAFGDCSDGLSADFGGVCCGVIGAHHVKHLELLLLLLHCMVVIDYWLNRRSPHHPYNQTALKFIRMKDSPITAFSTPALIPPIYSHPSPHIYESPSSYQPGFCPHQHIARYPAPNFWQAPSCWPAPAPPILFREPTYLKQPTLAGDRNRRGQTNKEWDESRCRIQVSVLLANCPICNEAINLKDRADHLQKHRRRVATKPHQDRILTQYLTKRNLPHPKKTAPISIQISEIKPSTIQAPQDLVEGQVGNEKEKSERDSIKEREWTMQLDQQEGPETKSQGSYEYNLTIPRESQFRSFRNPVLQNSPTERETPANRDEEVESVIFLSQDEFQIQSPPPRITISNMTINSKPTLPQKQSVFIEDPDYFQSSPSPPPIVKSRYSDLQSGTRQQQEEQIKRNRYKKEQKPSLKEWKSEKSESEKKSLSQEHQSESGKEPQPKQINSKHEYFIRIDEQDGKWGKESQGNGGKQPQGNGREESQGNRREGEAAHKKKKPSNILAQWQGVY